MTALNRKLVRDLAQMKGQALAIALVMACGVATFVMSLSTLDSLYQAKTSYYARRQFADVFVHLKRAPSALAARIAEIPGVARIQTRVVVDVTLDVPGLAEPAVGRLISVPEFAGSRSVGTAVGEVPGGLGSALGLNALHLRRGRWIEPARQGEVLVSEAFAEAHGLHPGDSIRAVINGKLARLTMVGVVLSPEYVYQIRPGDFFPDDKRFGVFWMSESELAPSFDLHGAFNDVAVSLVPGASEPEIIRRLDHLLEPYGGLGAFGRDDQVSNRYISDELTQLRGMGMIPPIIFLAVAALLLNVVVSRLIGTQREQIAALKAFGYHRREVGAHYLVLAVCIAGAGAVLGVAVGAWMGQSLTSLYTRFFRFPVFVYRLEPRVAGVALLVSSAAALGACLGAVSRAMRLPPAEAMRPEPPARYRQALAERLGLRRLLSPAARMILRNLERRPVRAALSVLGIALAVAVLILGSFMEDAVYYLVDLEFFQRQRQDVSVTFVEPRARRALYELERLPGVRAGEPFRAVPARLRFGHHARRLAIMGIPPDARLHRLLDRRRRVVSLPTEGILLSTKLAELLAIRPGENLTVEVLEGARPTRRIRVAGLVDELIGTSATMNLEALNRLLREGPSLSGAFLAIDSREIGRLYSTLKATPGIAAVTVKTAALLSFEKTLGENLLRMRMINVLFAGVIAFGVVYNTARIAVSERSHELASLRVLGFTRAEVSAILLGELSVLTLAAIPLGLLIGRGFAALAVSALDTETHRIPLVIATSTYAFAALVTIAGASASGLIVRRKLDRLDLIAVLKTRE